MAEEKGGFKTEAFLSANFQARTAEVEVPDMKDWFEEGAKAVWKVRGLTGYEYGRVVEAPKKYRNMDKIVSGLLSGIVKDQVESIRQLFGVQSIDDVPDLAIKNIEMVIIGSVDPPGSLDLAVKLCNSFPFEFYAIAKRVEELTGQGYLPGE